MFYINKQNMMKGKYNLIQKAIYCIGHYGDKKFY